MSKLVSLLCLVIMLCMSVLSTSAQQVTKQAALEKAIMFLQKPEGTNSNTRKASRKEPQLVLANNRDEFYIFNDEVNGGYVIVSGDERTPDVLAYSDNGHYDTRNVPCNMQAVLDGYAEQISYLRANPEYKMPVSTRADETKVAPLLGETAWNQEWPYNNLCPTIDGQHCPTGCVATAAAQVMYYHKWPERGKGYHSYEWNGQTLSADFSQSVYRWDLMTPTYDQNSSQESCGAVALLMRDVGYAQEMYYDIRGSGPRLWIGQGLASFFDYDESIIPMLNRNYCDADSWHNFILDDLLNGMPVLYSAAVSKDGAYHQLVIDGYDGNGFFHFNFGWGGSSNGFYTMLNIPFNIDQDITFGIKKNEGSKKRFIFAAHDDFLYIPETDVLNCKSLTCFHLWKTARVVEWYFALAVENTVSHEISYTNIAITDRIPIVEWNFVQTLPDGNYILYPVARSSEEEPWQKFLFYDQRQTFVDLNVTDGKKTFTNNHINDYIQDGIVVIDGIFYILDDTNHEATVTSKNDKYNSYSGDVTIPATINYNNQNYQVNIIDKRAFYESKGLFSVTIPNSIVTIRDEAFSYSGIKSISIPNSVKKIGTDVFDGCESLTYATIPDSWKIIPWGTFAYCGFTEFTIPYNIKKLDCCAFQGTKLISINIPNSIVSIDNYAFCDCPDLCSVILPRSVTFIGIEAFSFCKALKDIYLERADPEGYHCSEDAFTDTWIEPSCTLHVPIGCKEAYASLQPWSEFQNIVEDESLGMVSIQSNEEKSNDIYSISGIRINPNKNALPKGIYIQRKKKIMK